MEQQIISSYNHQELRELLARYSTKCVNRRIWKINPKWELPIPLQSVLNSLPKGKQTKSMWLVLKNSRKITTNFMELLKIIL